MESIHNWLSSIEKSKNLTEYTFEGVDLWPVIKNYIFFYDRRANVFKSGIGSFLYNITRNSKTRIGQDLSDFRNNDILFFGNQNYRNVVSDVSYNKFFDPLIDSLKNEWECRIVEYGKKCINPYKQERVFHLKNKMSFSFLRSIKIPNNVLSLLKDSAAEFGFNPKFFLRIFRAELIQLLNFKEYYLKVLKGSEVKLVVVLSYYSIEIMGLITACKQLGITTIDMQHGGLGEKHPAYHFYNYPTTGFNTLPHSFWLWDENSFNVLNKWTSNFPLQPKIVGNPWWSVNFKNFEENNFIILFALTLGEPDDVMPDLIKDVIRKSEDQYIWYIRFHPRSSKALKKKVLSKLDDLPSYKYEVKNANDYPLPLLLKKCWAHIAHSSGSLLEAAKFGVQRNIVFGEVGRNYYATLIKENKLYFYDSSKDLFSFIKSIEKFNVAENKTELSEFTRTIQETI